MSNPLAEIHAFLLGEGPLDGVYFGDLAADGRGKFWWRVNLRAALAKQQASPDAQKKAHHEDGLGQSSTAHGDSFTPQADSKPSGPPFYVGGPYLDGSFAVCDLFTGRVLRMFRGEDDLLLAAGTRTVHVGLQSFRMTDAATPQKAEQQASLEAQAVAQVVTVYPPNPATHEVQWLNGYRPKAGALLYLADTSSRVSEAKIQNALDATLGVCNRIIDQYSAVHCGVDFMALRGAVHRAQYALARMHAATPPSAPQCEQAAVQELTRKLIDAALDSDASGRPDGALAEHALALRAALAQGTTPAAGVGEQATGGWRPTENADCGLDGNRCSTYIGCTAFGCKRATKPAQAEPMSGALWKALERMDRARGWLTGGMPYAACNWAVLDTSDLRAILADAGIKEKT